MDKSEALKVFVRTNKDLFKADPFPYANFKRIKKEFFIDYAKIGGTPKDSEIAKEFLLDMISSGQIANESQISEVFKYPFIDENTPDKESFNTLLKEHSPIEPLLNYSNIKQEEYQLKLFEKLKEQALEAAKQAKQKELQELEAKIAEKRDEYSSLPSILDSSEYERMSPPKIENQQEDEHHLVLWWEKMGLTRNPFPEDLTEYKNLLEQIVQKTSIYLRYEQLIEKVPEELFRNTIFYGEFGSGKSTFFDFISLRLYSSKIRPVYIQVYGEFDVHSIVFSFKRKLFEELYKIHIVEASQRPIFTDQTNIDQQIRDLLTSLSNLCHIYGVIIFIDDIHKGDNLENSLKFISQLQITKDDLKRRLPAIKVAFYISGSPDMESKISKDPKYLGSVSFSEHMPPITVDIAQEAINKRLRIFSRNKNNPREVDKKFIERIIKSIEFSEQPVTFRTILQYVRDEFDQGRFTGLTVDPNKILSSTLGDMRQHIENNPEVRSQFYRFLNNHSKHLTNEERNYCFKKLIEIHLSGGLSDSEIAAADAYYLRLLNMATLIIKTNKDGNLVWRVSYSLAACNNEIERKFGVSLEDYLMPLFGSDLNEKPQIAVIRKEVEEMDRMLRTLEAGQSHDHLSLARRLHSEVLANKEDCLRDERRFGEIVKLCSKSITAITAAYVTWERIPIKIVDDTDVLVFWKDFWFTPNALEVYFRVVNGNEEKRKMVHQAVSFYLDAFPEIFGFFQKQHTKSKQIRIPLSDLKNDEIRELNACLDKWIENDLMQTLVKINPLIEKKVSTFVFNIFSILYGAPEAKLRIPDELHQSMEISFIKETPGDNNNTSQGFWSPYADLIMGSDNDERNGKYWDHIFKEIFDPWNKKDLNDILQTFDKSHSLLNNSTNGSLEIDRNFILELLNKSKDMIIKINQTYLEILSPKFMKRTKEGVVFSFCNFQDEYLVTPIPVSIEQENRLWEIIHERTMTKCRLDVQDYIMESFGTDYRTFCAVLSLLQNPVMTTDGVKQVIISRIEGSDIYLKAPELNLFSPKLVGSESDNKDLLDLKRKSLEELLRDRESSILEFKATLKCPVRMSRCEQ